MSSPPATRGSTENPPITRSETWMNDGNVVLQAGNKQFRVHWGVLALHSHVFRDMQWLPQPEDQPTIDGCPVVELFDDPADVEYLLKAFYIPSFHCQRVLPLSVVGALIRLGHKYDIEDLYDSAVARLTSRCPTTLEEYDETLKLLNPLTPTVELYRGLNFDMVALANDNNLLCVLPCAYYRAIRFNSLDGLFGQVAKEDGTVAFLSPAALRRCLVGRETLLKIITQPGYPLAWVREMGADDCTDSAGCRAGRETVLIRNASNTFVQALMHPHHLITLQFCPSCTRHIETSIIAGRKKIWDELPQIFGLPPWSELKNNM